MFSTYKNFKYLIVKFVDVICPKYCKSEAVAQLCSAKLRFRKISQISQNTSKMKNFFCKL